MKEFIICSAIKIGDKIWRGHRHGHALQAMNDEMLWDHTREEITKMYKEQGFITSMGRYVDRSEAYQIQKEAGIESIDEKRRDGTGYQGGELFSEDLY